MFKRILLVAVAATAVHSGAALADNNWAFDDTYWKSPARSGAMTSYTTHGGNAVNAQFGKYEQVDGYNY
jgi:hypothetical protein